MNALTIEPIPAIPVFCVPPLLVPKFPTGRMQLLSFLCAVLLVAIDGCTYKDCDHPDFGSCGNACCKLVYNIEGLTTEATMNALSKTLLSGGPDGQYTPQMTAEGTLLFGDLRPYDKPVDFIGQVWHVTTNKAYNDTINLTIGPGKGKSTQVTAFSVSQIAGAYGDDGQNYYNIVQIFEAVDWASLTGHRGGPSPMHADMSCPKAKA